MRQYRHSLGLTIEEMAEKGGVYRGSQIKYEKGYAPTADYLENIGDDSDHLAFIVYKARVPNIASLPEQENASETKQEPAFKEISEAKGMINLPMYQHVHASAGPGQMPADQEISSAISFEEKYLREMGATPKHCAVIEARGDSMSPAIPDGAMLVVDHSQIAVEHGFIYVFNIGEMVVVKRASWSLSQKLTLKSDNPAHNYPDDTFSKEDADALNVVGRVIFYGRKA